MIVVNPPPISVADSPDDSRSGADIAASQPEARYRQQGDDQPADDQQGCGGQLLARYRQILEGEDLQRGVR